MKTHGRIPAFPMGLKPGARRVAVRCQLDLLGRALGPWPRRHAPLLEINCGNGAFLPFLWQCGFDLEASEANHALAEKARASKIPGLLVHATDDQDIPLENDSFDWVILHLATNDPDRAARAAGEGIRLARRGFMLTFWNTASIPSLCHRVSHPGPWATGMPFWQMGKILSRLQAGHITPFSTLPLPPALWKWPIAGLHIPGLPIGAWCIFRIDPGPQYPVTPLPLTVGNVINRQTEPLLEYSPKSDRAQISVKK